MDIQLLFVVVFLAATVQVYPVQTQEPIMIESQGGIDLEQPSYLTTTWPTDTGFAIILEALERLEAENSDTKRTLSEVNQQLLELREENGRLQTELNDLKGQTTSATGATACPRLCDERIQTIEQQIQLVLHLRETVANISYQQAAVARQTETFLTVLGAVAAFEDDYRNITERLEVVEEKLSTLEFREIVGLWLGSTTQPLPTVTGTVTDIGITEPPACDSTQFACENGYQCVMGHWRCDGDIDCDDASDEVSCDTDTPGPVSCDEVSQFSCLSDNTCIPGYWRCDGGSDCSDGSDEYGCAHSGGEASLKYVVPSEVIEPYGHSLVSSLVIIDDRKIVMTDYVQNQIKVMTLDDPSEVNGKVSVSYTPWSLALLSDGLIAVAMEDWHTIDLVHVNGSDPELVKTITTDRNYRGVCQGPDDNLVVGTRRNDEDEEDGMEARIDVISRDGQVLRTLVDGLNDSNVVRPYFFTRYGEDVYVSDWGSHRIYRVDLETGQVKSSFYDLDLFDLDLSQPRVVAFDNIGNMYVATNGGACTGNAGYGSWCILQVNVTGNVEVFVNFDGFSADRWPYGISVGFGEIIVSLGYWGDGWNTELRVYELPA